jgi:hypothetical protein
MTGSRGNVPTQTQSHPDDRNLQTVRRWYEEMWSLPDPDIADEIIHPDYAPHWVHIPAKGPEQLKIEIRYFRGMFPDLKYTLMDAAVDGDKVWAWYRGRATHLGPGWGFEPTGKTVEFDGMAICYFDSAGLIVDRWAVYSFYDIFTELGLVPPWWEISKYLGEERFARGED